MKPTNEIQRIAYCYLQNPEPADVFRMDLGKTRRLGCRSCSGSFILSDNADVLSFLLALRAPVRPMIRRSTNMTLALSLDRERSISFGFLFDRGNEKWWRRQGKRRRKEHFEPWRRGEKNWNCWREQGE